MQVTLNLKRDDVQEPNEIQDESLIASYYGNTNTCCF